MAVSIGNFQQIYHIFIILDQSLLLTNHIDVITIKSLKIIAANRARGKRSQIRSWIGEGCWDGVPDLGTF